MVFVRFNEPDNARLGGLFGLGFAVITDDDSGAVVRPGSAEVTETDAATTVDVPLTLSEPATNTVSVDWRTVDNSATAPGDFTAASGTAVFSPGETQTSVSIQVRGDNLPEPREIVVVQLSNPQNSTIGGWLGLGFAFINDDD